MQILPLKHKVKSADAPLDTAVEAAVLLGCIGHLGFAFPVAHGRKPRRGQPRFSQVGGYTLRPLPRQFQIFLIAPHVVGMSGNLDR